MLLGILAIFILIFVPYVFTFLFRSIAVIAVIAFALAILSNLATITAQ